jgi:hypothetical protein
MVYFYLLFWQVFLGSFLQLQHCIKDSLSEVQTLHMVFN